MELDMELDKELEMELRREFGIELDEELDMEGIGLYDGNRCRVDIDWDRFGAEIERVLCGWKKSSGSPSWNKSVETLKFEEAKFVLTRHWTCGISEERKSGEDNQGDKKEAIEIPKAWLDMMDKSNLFPRCDSHAIHRYFGLKDFVVIEHRSSAELEDPQRVTREFSSIACKNGWHVPVFWKHRCSKTYVGILEWPGFRTTFRLMNANFEGDPHCISSFYDLFKNRDLQMDEPVGVSVRLTYIFHDYPSKDLDCLIGYGVTKDEYYHFDDYEHNSFELQAIWSDPLEYCDITSKWVLDPLHAPDWTVRVEVIDTSDVPLVDCLTRFLSLCSPTQSGTLLWNPQISSMLKCRIYKHRGGLIEPKVRKVTPKLILKPEESVIPVESLNAILDFLFCDAKLQSPQNLSGDNPITTTTAEDEVEDNFFLSYKELSKYFKSTQISSLIGRLAVCTCIVNKYHGGLVAVNQLWGEFVLEMKYRVENNCGIKGLEPVKTTLDYANLLQKLQVLNNCIEKKKASDASSPITDTSTDIKNNTEIASEDISDLRIAEEGVGPSEASDEFIDISDWIVGKEGAGQPEARKGTSTSGSKKIQKLIDNLVWDKKAFKFVNQGCFFGDFMNWCSREAFTEEMDKGYNEDRLRLKIKLSDEAVLIFQKSAHTQKRFLDDDVVEVLCWLASVKPSDLVFGFMPMLMHSTVTTLLGHTEILQLPFLINHLNEIKIKVEDLASLGAPDCDYNGRIKKFEDIIRCLTFVEQRMADAQYLLKKFRHVDPSHTVSDLELQEFVCNLVQFREASVLRSSTELRRIIYTFFINGCKHGMEASEIPSARSYLPDQVEELLEPTGREYIFRYSNSCQSAPISCRQFHCTYFPYEFYCASAFTCREDEEDDE